ncbi:hypothetical protein ACW9HQ_47415, partial [Nocardia gipuzkoensis]
ESTKYHLGPLPSRDGLELLATIIGMDRFEQEESVAAGLIDIVGSLPLAIRFIGDRLVSSGLTPAQLRQQVPGSDNDVRLSDLAPLGFDLFDRIDAVYRDLSRLERTVFCGLVAIRDRPFGLDEVTGRLRTRPGQTEIALLSLIDSGLVEISGGPWTRNRSMTLPPMVASYLAELDAARRRTSARHRGRAAQHRPQHGR